MDIISRLKDFSGYWRHTGGRYLAELASGKVSDLFCNTTVVTCRPEESCLPEAAKSLSIKMLDVLDPRNDGWDSSDEYERQNSVSDLYVCGPAFGGITLSYEVARQLGGVSIFTEPVYAGGCDVAQSRAESAAGCCAVYKTGQALKRFTVPGRSHVLFVEDVITTGKSTLDMMDAVWAKQDPKQLLRNLECVLCLVNRSGKDYLEFPNKSRERWPIITLANEDAHTWDTIIQAQAALAVTCDATNNPPELAARNEVRATVQVPVKLEAVRPKDNWDKLNEG